MPSALQCRIKEDKSLLLSTQACLINALLGHGMSSLICKVPGESMCLTGGHADSAEADTASADGQKLERDRRLEELQRSHEKAAALQRQQVCVLVYADPSHEHYMHIALQRAARVTSLQIDYDPLL
eukprot:scaffold191147_cov18-Tisochrysis_lutea.AAC.1